MSDRGEDRFRLSDGRDARDILEYLDAVGRGDVAPPEFTRAEVIESWWPEGIATNKWAFAMLIASRRLTAGLRKRDDWETLLRTSREMWGDAPQEQGIMCNPWAVWQIATATDLRYPPRAETFEDWAGRVGSRLLRVVGGHLDVRDAESIAVEYLERGREALRDVPSRYRDVHVAAKVLDLEETRAGDEAEALRAARDDRRRDLLLAFKGVSVSRQR